MTSSQHQLPRKLIRGLVITWLVLFAVGVHGHLQLGNNLSDSLFKSLQLFHLHYHPEPTPHEPAPPGGTPSVHAPAADIPVVTSARHLPDTAESRWSIEIARFGCALWGLAILPVFAGFLFERRVQQWWVMHWWKKHYVVCGDCSRTRALVADLSKKKHRVAWVGRCAADDHEPPRHVFRIDGDSGDPAVLSKAAVSKAAHLVALHEDDRLNIETLVAAGTLCAKRPANMPDLDAYAHVADVRLELTLRGMIESGSGFAGKGVHEHTFNYYGLIARLLARQFPMPPTLAEAPPPPEHIILVGFAAFGQSAALRIMLTSQQLYREQLAGETAWRVARPRITVLDPQAVDRVAEFDRLHPEFRNYCDLESHPVATTDLRFSDQSCFAAGGNGERRTLVFCIETEAEAMRVVETISRMNTSNPRNLCGVARVFLRIARPERLGSVLDRLKSSSGMPEVTCFAADAEVFNADVILNQSLDILARECHKAYLAVEEADRRANNLPTASAKTWEQLGESDRESNREAADHLWAKLHILGYHLTTVPKGDIVPPPPADLLRDLKSREEDMARAEHYRWMTWRILNGWSFGDPRDNDRKLHPDIRDYDELADSTQNKDRVNIRVIPELLRQGHLMVTRASESEGNSD